MNQLKELIKLLFLSDEMEDMKIKKTVNYAGYIATPPAFILNIGEWMGGITLNQFFTFLISTAVVIFWILKIKEQSLKIRKAEKELEK